MSTAPETTVPETEASILPEGLLYVDGVLRRAQNGRTFDNIGPWTGERVGVAANASRQDVEEAIAAARRAFDTTDWATDHDKRFALVKKLYDLFEANRDRLVAIARHEVGAPLMAVNRAQVANCLNSWRDLMEVYPNVKWEKDYGVRETAFGTSQRTAHYEAIGVVAAITPWNFPLYVNAEKVVSALLAGCTVILKPAPDTPLAGVIFGELAAEAGFPAGVLNVITASDPAEAGEMLVTDPRVDLITFTGSTAIGKHITRQGAETMKRAFLELGGKSVNIVLEDTPNFAQVVAQSILVFHAGQGCAVQSRLLVPRSRYEEAKQVLKAAYDGFADKWGDFDEPSCAMGPVVSKQQMERVKAYVDIGIAEGATLLSGGELRPDIGTGWFIEPTCFATCPTTGASRRRRFRPGTGGDPVRRRRRRGADRQRQRLRSVRRSLVGRPAAGDRGGQARAHRHDRGQRRRPDQRRPAVRRLQAERHRPRLGRRGHRGISRNKSHGLSGVKASRCSVFRSTLYLRSLTSGFKLPQATCYRPVSGAIEDLSPVVRWWCKFVERHGT